MDSEKYYLRGKISAIATYRERKGGSLLDSKRAVDAWADAREDKDITTNDAWYDFCRSFNFNANVPPFGWLNYQYDSPQAWAFERLKNEVASYNRRYCATVRLVIDD